MSYVIVLADSIHEGNAYARSAGLPRGRFRIPTSAASIRGLRVAEVHELPSFGRRRDRHAINAELRFVKGPRIRVEAPTRVEALPVDQGDGMGEQLTIDDVMAEEEAAEKPQWQKDLDAILEPEGWEPPESLSAEDVLLLAANPDARGADVLERINEPGPAEPGGLLSEPAVETVEAAAKRRRSRCKDCGDLDFPETHACPVALRAATPAPTAADLTMWD